MTERSGIYGKYFLCSLPTLRPLHTQPGSHMALGKSGTYASAGNNRGGIVPPFTEAPTPCVIRYHDWRMRMSKLSTRYRINETVFNAMATRDISGATNSILDIIRSALLSEPAVNAAMRVVEYRSQEPFAAQDWKEERDDWKEAFSAAWDSVIEE